MCIRDRSWDAWALPGSVMTAEHNACSRPAGWGTSDSARFLEDVPGYLVECPFGTVAEDPHPFDPSRPSFGEPGATTVGPSGLGLEELLAEPLFHFVDLLPGHPIRDTHRFGA